MKKGRFILAFAVVLPSFAAGPSTDIIETFDELLEQATWRVGTQDKIDDEIGNPGKCLRNPDLDAAVPRPVFIGSSAFLGDYRAAGVTSLGIDVNIFAASIGVDHSRSITLVLASDMGTPDDPSDDCEVFFVGNRSLPRVGSGWQAYEFRVPSDRTRLPGGWSAGACAELSLDETWNAVITHVTHVEFPFGDPGTAWFFQIWDLAIDNVRITFRNPR